MDQMTCTPPFPSELFLYSVVTCNTGSSNIAKCDYEMFVKLKKMWKFTLGEDKNVLKRERYWFDHITCDMMPLGMDAHRQKCFYN